MCCRDCPLSRNGSRNLHYNHLLLVQLMTMMMTTMGVVGSPRLKGGGKDRDENVKVVEEGLVPIPAREKGETGGFWKDHRRHQWAPQGSLHGSPCTHTLTHDQGV
eukprot:TRINITY_DN41721_c0_g1_i2.p1 TRINITY_DN41721_c0_g1~~TRINITY_DN41721_c0_g1_i2.p1  ORF type:complete len:105 (+),score=23.54 TRINITY_DN41721_c0_g1_i2:408-722(+)